MLFLDNEMHPLFEKFYLKSTKFDEMFEIDANENFSGLQ